MQLNIIPFIATFLSLAKAETYCPSQPANTTTQSSIFNTFVQKFYINKDVQTAFLDHVDVNYTQHNPYALSGRDNAIAFLTENLPLVNISLMHVGFSNGTGYVHYREDGLDGVGGQPAAVVDVLRLEGSCIVEHWDVVQVRPVNATNPIALF